MCFCTQPKVISLFLYLNITFWCFFVAKDENKKSKGFWSTTRIIFALFLVLGILIGAILTHFFVEPAFFTPALKKELEEKTNEWKELQQQYIDCMNEKEGMQKTQT